MRKFIFLAIVFLFAHSVACAATVTSLGSTFNTTAGDKTVTATPAVNDLIVVIGTASGTTQTNGDTTNVTDNNSSGTYTKIVSDTSGTVLGMVTIWIRNSLISSATSTIFTATQTNSNGGGLEVFKVTSMTRTGSSAARQSANGNGAGATMTITYGSASLTGNPNIGGVMNVTNPATVTPPTSWTESIDTGYATPTIGVEDAFINSGFTGTSASWSQTAQLWEGCMVELDTSAAATGNYNFFPFFSLLKPSWLWRF